MTNSANSSAWLYSNKQWEHLPSVVCSSHIMHVSCLSALFRELTTGTNMYTERTTNESSTKNWHPDQAMRPYGCGKRGGRQKGRCDRCGVWSRREDWSAAEDFGERLRGEEGQRRAANSEEDPCPRSSTPFSCSRERAMLALMSYRQTPTAFPRPGSRTESPSLSYCSATHTNRSLPASALVVDSLLLCSPANSAPALGGSHSSSRSLARSRASPPPFRESSRDKHERGWRQILPCPPLPSFRPQSRRKFGPSSIRPQRCRIARQSFACSEAERADRCTAPRADWLRSRPKFHVWISERRSDSPSQALPSAQGFARPGR